MAAAAATIINVSNRLPVKLGEDGSIQPSSGGLVAALQGASMDRFTLHWTGWPGATVPEEQQKELRRRLWEEHGLSPVFLEAGEAEAYYEGFSNSSLWPLLHYMLGNFRYEAEWWEAYHQVNRRFADEIIAQAKGDEIVWVHDYHLMLLPRMLRQACPSLRIGFFLHTPFPSFEVFRCHPRREELVDGLLGSDIVGFHTFGYLRHFRSTVLRLLDVDADVTHILHDGGRATALGVYPIGIHADRFVEEMTGPEFRRTLEELRRAHEGKRVVISVERLDYSKGLLQRLEAIELFLRESGLAGEMRFIFVAVPSREGVEAYRRLIEEVEARVGRINGNYATISNAPVQFVHQSISFTELCALYSLAEVAMVTPVRDGMNLVAKEYVACQQEAPGQEPGVLLLSEFAGAAEVLFDAIIINPYDVRGMAEALGAALSLPAAERARRMGSMRDRVLRFDAAWWARSFIDDLKEARPQDRVAAAERLDPAELGNRLREAIGAGRRVAMFLDYDGTLREIVRDPAAAGPSDEVRDLLRLLARQKGVDVTIVSGRTPEDLEQFIGEFTEFSLIAEHGASIRRPGTGEWEQLDRNISYRWKEQVAQILRLYEASTPGSFVEDKRTSLVWHFRRADPEFGTWKARQLVGELEAVIANQPLNARMGRKIVEVTVSHVNKGAAVSRLLEESQYDLVLVVGDDTTDESMYALEIPSLLSLNIGERPTQARYVLPSPAALRELLRRALRD